MREDPDGAISNIRPPSRSGNNHESHPGSNLELLGGISLPNAAMQYQATA